MLAAPSCLHPCRRQLSWGVVPQGFTDVTWTGLAWSLVLILLVLVLSRLQGLGLERNLLVGCLRTIIQLILIGYILGWIINAANPWLVLLAATGQLLTAVWTAGGLQHPPLRGARLIAFVALLPAFLLVIAVLVFLVIRPAPWWDARLVLPLGGMLLGNALAAVALALNRYRGELEAKREPVLARVALGVGWPQAVADVRRNAAHAALLPTVSALLTVGLVALPGMMSGQIIAGLDPLVAVRYQIVVMFMIAAVAAIAVTIALYAITRRARFEARDTARN